MYSKLGENYFLFIHRSIQGRRGSLDVVAQNG